MPSVRQITKRRRERAKAHAPEASSVKSKRAYELERAVANIERVLQPRAQVKWNMRLPTRDGPRQFDVVVSDDTDLVGRAFTTVFEVQSRGRPVDIAAFQGWIPKAASARAERLTCVSEAGFAKAVRSSVERLDSRAQLILLNTAHPAPFPIEKAFVEVVGFHTTEAAALTIPTGTACLRLQGKPGALTLEDLVWQRSFDFGYNLHAAPPNDLPTPQLIIPLTRGPEKVFFTNEAGGREIKQLTVLIKLVQFTVADCTVQDAAYYAEGSHAPYLWATHAQVLAWGAAAEVTLASLKDVNGKDTIRQRISSLEGSVITRAIPNLDRNAAAKRPRLVAQSML